MLNNRSMPRATVSPVLAYPDVRAAADWLWAAFGFRVRLRIGGHRIQLHAGDGSVVLAQSADASAFEAPNALALHSVMVRVEDVDSHYQRALELGARGFEQPQDFATASANSAPPTWLATAGPFRKASRMWTLQIGVGSW